MGYLDKLLHSTGIGSLGGIGQGSTIVAVLLFLFFAPVIISPLRYLLGAVTQSAALLMGNIITLGTNIGVSILQIGNAGAIGLRPLAYRGRALLAAGLILLCGVFLGIMISLLNIPEKLSTLSQEAGRFEFFSPDSGSKEGGGFETF